MSNLNVISPNVEKVGIIPTQQGSATMPCMAACRPHVNMMGHNEGVSAEWCWNEIWLVIGRGDLGVSANSY